MDCFSNFNIVGYSPPLLPCRLVDLRKGLIYSKNLQHNLSLPSYSHNYSDYTSVPNSPFHRLEHSLRPTSSLRNSCFVIEFKPLFGELEPTRVIDLS